MNLPTRQERLGSGWAVPLAPGKDGRMIVAEGADKVRQGIFIILDTEPGERIMLPEFGCGLRRFLMQPNSPATRAEIERAVTRSLAQWEPRIKTSRVDVSPGEDPSLIVIEIQYAHVFDGRRDSFVYPFYLE